MNKFSLGLIKNLKRRMSLHEYQATSLLSSYSLPTLRGEAAFTIEQADKIAKSIGGGVVIKAQVHAGGRGRGIFKKSGLNSGVHILDSPDQARMLASKMIGDHLITKQSGKEGKPVNSLFIVEKISLNRELYLSITVDRENACPVFIASPKGGMGIEEIEKKYILQQRVGMDRLKENEAEKIANFLEPENEDQKSELMDIIKGLYNIFKDKDAVLVEINPLGITREGKVKICDSKVNIDDNASIRQKEIFDKEDLSQKNKIEVEAAEADLNYVKLDGNIGCIVNGAGLAMATMDLINFNGGKPANFLDVGGTVDFERSVKAMSIVNDDSDVKVILVNIFGGIVRCDVLVEGIIKAVEQLNITKPIFVRVKGTNADKASKVIKESNMSDKIFLFDKVDEAARQAIKAAI